MSQKPSFGIEALEQQSTSGSHLQEVLFYSTGDNTVSSGTLEQDLPNSHRSINVCTLVAPGCLTKVWTRLSAFFGTLGFKDYWWFSIEINLKVESCSDLMLCVVFSVISNFQNFFVMLISRDFYQTWITKYRCSIQNHRYLHRYSSV